MRVVEQEAYPQEGIALPDYAQPKPTGQVPVGPVWTSTDIGELAARLGSIVSYDRRGNVVELDGFEGPVLKWNATRAVLDSSNVRSGNQAVKFQTDNVALQHALIGKTVALLASKKLGIEISFCYLSTNLDFYLNMEYDDGTTRYYQRLKIDPATREVSVYTTGGAYTKVADYAWQLEFNWSFQAIKLVADFATGYYKRLLYNLSEWDISNIPIFQEPSAGIFELAFGSYVYNKAALGGSVWIDNYILTQNEPENIK